MSTLTIVVTSLVEPLINNTGYNLSYKFDYSQNNTIIKVQSNESKSETIIIDSLQHWKLFNLTDVGIDLFIAIHMLEN